VADRIKGLPGAQLRGWMVETCVGSYPLAVIASSRTAERTAVTDGSFLVLTVELDMDGGPWIGAAPLIVGRPNL
jgi:hypothetical protein